MARRPFRVTQENEAEVWDYLSRLANDGTRFPDALAAGVSPGAARVALDQPDANLNRWIERCLSKSGRTRLINALAQRRRSKTLVNWRLPEVLFNRIQAAAKSEGTSLEVWLETVTTNTARRVSA